MLRSHESFLQPGGSASELLLQVKRMREAFRKSVLRHGLVDDIRPFTEAQHLVVQAGEHLSQARYFLQLLEDVEIDEPF